MINDGRFAHSLSSPARLIKKFLLASIVNTIFCKDKLFFRNRHTDDADWMVDKNPGVVSPALRFACGSPVLGNGNSKHLIPQKLPFR
jgi:hypothetical protein